ncbi:hypothetical protein RB623_28140 [Mesorhizobium sp. LHD-90]|uniref:hypothetical protein n=1 Tax=Mesorhizobium sp. LHD-90 TaxID=3071414 RepID=UPI0027DFA940|nr:hypothetical protein [Mesorhizobium sp. LHD-90]MDQ6437941.1 hypothetical protein [Mesorhizobium sp. LHD-90]
MIDKTASGEESVSRQNWVAWTFNFFYPPTIAVLGVIVISRYYDLPIAGNIGKELSSLIRGTVLLLLVWWNSLF